MTNFLWAMADFFAFCCAVFTVYMLLGLAIEIVKDFRHDR